MPAVSQKYLSTNIVNTKVCLTCFLLLACRVSSSFLVILHSVNDQQPYCARILANLRIVLPI